MDGYCGQKMEKGWGMSRPNPLIFALVLAIIVVAVAATYLAKDGLYLIAHEIDTYHVIDVLFRMRNGAVPHIDFVTPLGVLNFLPFLLFLEMGESVGRAILKGQILVAALLFPFVWYAGQTRLGRGAAYFFGASTLWLVLALGWGGDTSQPAISMFYNRWAWGAAFVAIVLAMIPSTGRPRTALDGAILGTLAMVLLLMKVTYFVALAPGIIAALAARGENRGIGIAMATFAALIIVVMGFAGLEFWPRYIGDLWNVSRSDVRGFTGVPLAQIIGGPAKLAVSITGLLSVLYLSRIGMERLALAMLLLVPGFVYIDYQNFGNDPQWLLILAVILMATRPEFGVAKLLGQDTRFACNTLIVVALVLFLPSTVNLLVSPFKHLWFDQAEFQPMLSEFENDRDLFVRNDRALSVRAIADLSERVGDWAALREGQDFEDTNSGQTLAGLTFPNCELGAGSTLWLRKAAERLSQSSVPAGSMLFSTDVLSSYWLFGDMAPLEQGAPWYYGDLTGIENADFVLAPKCPYSMRVRGIIFRELEAADLDLTLVEENELYALFSIR